MCHGLIHEEGAQKVGMVIFTFIVQITPQVLAMRFEVILLGRFLIAENFRSRCTGKKKESLAETLV